MNEIGRLKLGGVSYPILALTQEGAETLHAAFTESPTALLELLVRGHKEGPAAWADLVTAVVPSLPREKWMDHGSNEAVIAIFEAVRRAAEFEAKTPAGVQ
jgi:hypothetical protein